MADSTFHMKGERLAIVLDSHGYYLSQLQSSNACPGAEDLRLRK